MENISIHELSLLVIEPSGVQAKILRERLKRLNIQYTRFVENGQAALEAMRLAEPDLVISSMYLPDMDAVNLVHRMRTDPVLQDIPFMLVSSETSFAMLDPLKQAGIIAILPKPFELHELKQALSATIDYISLDEGALVEIDIDQLAILVVDDSAMARKHITRVLNNLGIDHITTAENGKEAVQLIEANYYDLVITDYNMPEMDGEALTRYIRERSSQRAIPVLMVTSEDSGSRLSAVQQAGVSGICDKPFDPLTVKQMIRNLLATP